MCTCQASAEAYKNAKAGGKPAKIAGTIAAKAFYVEFFNSKITGIVPQCKNTVDATQSKSVANMVKYFNAAASNNLNVVTEICKAATVAYFNAKIDGKTPDEAKLAAAAAVKSCLCLQLSRPTERSRLRETKATDVLLVNISKFLNIF